MKKQVAIHLIAILLVLAIATPVLAAAYAATYTVKETAGTDYDMAGVIAPAPNNWMVANGYFNSTANDTQVATLGGSVQPHMVADNATLTAIPIPANSQTNLRLSTGNTPSQYMEIITGYGGYVSTNDTAALEFGDNFTLEGSGYIDTDAGADKHILFKNQALDVYTSSIVSGNITATIFGGGASSNTTVAPAGAGDATGIGGVTGAATHWQAVLTNDGDTSYVSDGSGVWVTDYYTISASIPYGSTITAMKTVVIFRSTAAAVVSAKSGLRLGGVNSLGAQHDNATTSYQDFIDTITRPGGGDWVADDLSTLQIALTIIGSGGPDCRATQVYLVIEYNLPALVSLTGVTTGEKTLVVDYAMPFLSMAEDQGTDITPPTADLVMNIPAIQQEVSATTFTTIDANAYSFTRSGGTWALNTGYTFAGAGNLKHTAAGWRSADDRGTIIVIFKTAAADGAMVTTADEATNNFFFQYTVSSGKLLIYQSNAGVAHGASGNTTVNDGNWHMGTLISNGTGYTMYVDNTLQTLTPAGTGNDGSWFSDTPNRDNLVIGALIRTATSGNFTGTIGYVDYYSQPFSSSDVTQYYNAIMPLFLGTGDIATYSTTASVPDNANPYIWMQNNSMNYANYIKLYKGGNLVLWYQPDDMVEHSLLPDHQGNKDGDITWGANPSGVTVTLGSMVSSSQPSIGSTATVPSTDILPQAGGANWNQVPDVTVQLLTNPLRPFILILSDNTSLTESQAWQYLGFVFVVFVFVAMAFIFQGHLLIAGIGGGVAIGVLVVQTIWPLWSLVFIVPSILGGFLGERSPSV